MIAAKFAFYWEMGEPVPSYLIIKSDDKNMIVGGNVGREQFKEIGEAVPETPSYQDWVNNGRKIYRGEGDIR